MLPLLPAAAAAAAPAAATAAAVEGAKITLICEVLLVLVLVAGDESAPAARSGCGKNCRWAWRWHMGHAAVTALPPACLSLEYGLVHAPAGGSCICRLQAKGCNMQGGAAHACVWPCSTLHA